MSDEITGYGGFHPASEAYVVKDFFTLVKDWQQPELRGVKYADPTVRPDPVFVLSYAAFMLIRSFEAPKVSG